MSSQEQASSIKPDIKVIQDEHELHKYKGLCEDSEVLWLGYLSWCYKTGIQPQFVAAHDKSGQLLGKAIKKGTLEGLPFGDPTELLIASNYASLQDAIISRENKELVARPIRNNWIDEVTTVIFMGRQNLGYILDAYQELLTDLREQHPNNIYNLEEVWRFLLSWAKSQMNQQKISDT